MLSQQDNIDDVDIERISQNSFDVAQDMLDNETEDNTNSRPELGLSEMDDMEKSKRNDKLSEDIYIIFHFIEGENNYSDMKSCISKWALKHNYETRSSQRLNFFRSDCISQSPKAPVNDNALQRTDEDDDRMSTIFAQIAIMNDKFEEKFSRLENQLSDTITQTENDILNLKSNLVETTKKLEEANSHIEQMKIKEEKLINDNRGMYFQMSSMATRENEIKELSSQIHQHLDVIMKKINCIEGKLDTICTRHKLFINQSNKGSGKKEDLRMKENHENHELSAYKESRHVISPSIHQENIVHEQKEIHKESAKVLPAKLHSNGPAMFTLNDFPPLSRNDQTNITENVSRNQRTEVTSYNENTSTHNQQAAKLD
ncbi:hypothetical protein ACJMK2_030300 [Sinanodonta woodiana]|uniref:Uncharacterized protein n=1 Tax=Sinanodonta woodiana TaxID=1069815 RepID=A0ABD3XGG4_SINWO